MKALILDIASKPLFGTGVTVSSTILYYCHILIPPLTVVGILIGIAANLYSIYKSNKK
jgi:hypothetical protein